MRNMKSIRLKTKELQSNNVEARNFVISQIRTSLYLNSPKDVTTDPVIVGEESGAIISRLPSYEV